MAIIGNIQKEYMKIGFGLKCISKIADKTGAFKASDWTFFVVENSTYAKEIALLIWSRNISPACNPSMICSSQ